MEKPSLQSKFFPPKFTFPKYKRKNLAGENLLCK
jgi:hypothetical protein